MSFRQYGDNPDYADPQSQDYLKGKDAPGGRQVALDQQGGDPRVVGSREDDISVLREGGQTNYVGTYGQGADPFDRVAKVVPKFETRFLDVDLQPVPIAVQEDRSMLVYDFVQKQYNVNVVGANLAATEIDVVEDGWWWMPDRVALFGTATGFITLADGNASDSSQVFAIQAGVANVLGGVQNLSGLIMSQRTPLVLRAIGVDANAALSIGLWYRKCKWVWSPPKASEGAPGYGDVEATSAMG